MKTEENSPHWQQKSLPNRLRWRWTFIAFLVLTPMKRSTYLCVHCKQYSYRVQCFRLFTLWGCSHTSKDSSWWTLLQGFM